MKSWILLIDFKILSFQVLDMILMRYALKNWVDLGIKKEKNNSKRNVHHCYLLELYMLDWLYIFSVVVAKKYCLKYAGIYYWAMYV